MLAVRRETSAERAAWTAAVAGVQAARPNKYGAVRTGKYASKHESDIATHLSILAHCGAISDLREQVSYTLVPGNGKIRPIKYIADFVYVADGLTVVADAKGYSKDKVYRLKKKLMALLHGIEIVEL